MIYYLLDLVHLDVQYGGQGGKKNNTYFLHINNIYYIPYNISLSIYILFRVRKNVKMLAIK